MDGDRTRLTAASVGLYPLPVERDMSFQIETSLLAAGQHQLSSRPRKELLRLLDRATEGIIDVYGHSFELGKEQNHDFYSQMTEPDRWYSNLHLQVIGRREPGPSAIDAARIDNALRRSNPPFDGIADVASWLGLSNPFTTRDPPSINISVNPPVDLIFSDCSLADDSLRLTLHAHPRFDVSRVGLAMRAVPGDALRSRQQISTKVSWKRVRNGRREGVAQVDLKGVDSALTMLMIGESTVRRQWFADPAKARNNRLIAVQHYDKDLRMLRQAVLEPSDAMRFEVGVATLLFLLGFSSAVQLETDSPYVVVTTPGGKLVIVECTIRVADFASKLGKLVDRRGSLSKAMQKSGYPAQVDAVLVCGLPRDQIAAQSAELEMHRTILITREELVAAFERVWSPSDPDQMIDAGVAQLTRARSAAAE